MTDEVKTWSCRRMAMRTTILLSVVLFFALSAIDIAAQKKFSRKYPAGQSVRLQLMNRTGTVTVEGWDRAEVSISASLESPAANIEPQSLSGTILINLVRDNHGRPEVGNVNFTIRVPYYTVVDIETKIGNLNVSNVRSGLVRAHITSEGDITLMNIVSTNVAAENVIGDIFFDGEIQPGGNYRFSSFQGNINLRIPFNSSFRIIATAPSTRNISPVLCANPNLNFRDGRRMFGQCGNGEGTVNVTNQRGNIAFFRR